MIEIANNVRLYFAGYHAKPSDVSSGSSPLMDIDLNGIPKKLLYVQKVCCNTVRDAV